MFRNFVLSVATMLLFSCAGLFGQAQAAKAKPVAGEISKNDPVKDIRKIDKKKTKVVHVTPPKRSIPTPPSK